MISLAVWAIRAAETRALPKAASAASRRGSRRESGIQSPRTVTVQALSLAPQARRLARTGMATSSFAERTTSAAATFVLPREVLAARTSRATTSLVVLAIRAVGTPAQRKAASAVRKGFLRVSGIPSVTTANVPDHSWQKLTE